jgi:trehalose-phosphatase
MKRLTAKVIRHIAAARKLFIFLDYDGTLTPIVARPTMAKLSFRQKEILFKLSCEKNIRIAVISGRALEDIQKCVGIPGIIYAGNHGLELKGPKTKQIHPAALAFRKIVKELLIRLERAYAFFPEMLIEDKIFSISVHHRQIPDHRIEFVKMILLKELGTYLSKSQVVLTEGKKVWEIRPPTEWNKGKTAMWLLGNIVCNGQPSVLPLYFGDDLTDEDAFKALKNYGITVRVTSRPQEPSAAKYWLDSPDNVFDFFERIIKIRSHKDQANDQG